MNKILILSDLHIGHPLNKFELLLEGFNKYVVTHLVDTDLLVITGDYFHTALNLNHIDTQHAFFFLSNLCNLSVKYKFKIRIIQGTYSHDRDQIQRFKPLLEGWDIDFKYLDSIYIEEMDGLRLLYLPDNPTFQHTQTLIELCQSMDISKNNPVDFIFSHGLYDFYQYKNNLPCYNLEYLSSICKNYILSGHIHTHRVHHKYISIGSFTRFRHGEEEDKGFVVLNYKDDKWKHKFYKNVLLIPFITLVLDATTEDLLLKQYTQKLQQYFQEDTCGFIKVIIPNIEHLSLLRSFTKERYPHLVFTHKPIKKTDFQAEFNLDTSIRLAQDLSNLNSLIQHIQQYIKENDININFKIKDVLIRLDHESKNIGK
jgi:DNA repair exonuclease SbcCD nuclease subunit